MMDKSICCKLRALIINDSKTMGMIIKENLLISGFRLENILLISDGYEALIKLSTKEFHLVISDMWMANSLNGIELLKRIRQHQNSSIKNIPFLMISGEISDDFVSSVFKAGANGYLTKSFNPKIFKNEVDKIFNTTPQFTKCKFGNQSDVANKNVLKKRQHPELIGMKVLVVEDSATYIALFEHAFDGSGLRLLTARSGEEALAILSNSIPDIILLDVTMPGMGGFETCRKIKADKKTKDIPIIFITATEDKNDIGTAFSVGGSDYIQKPFRVDELISRVQNQLKLKRALEYKALLMKEVFDAKAKKDQLVKELLLLKEKLEKSANEYLLELNEATLARERIDSELNVAREIQMNMVPKYLPEFSDDGCIDLAASIEPAKEVGGDFYDFYFLDKENLCFVIGDASGKGVPAALFVATTKTFIKALACSEDDECKIICKANNELCTDNDTSMFVTLFFGIINVKTGFVKYVNCGHNPPILMAEKNNIDYIKPLPNIVLGVMDDFEFKSQNFTMKPGDNFFLYTDGVTEAINSNGDEYSPEKLKSELIWLKNSTVEDKLEGISTSVNNFASGVPQSDDITMMFIQFNGEK